MNRYAQLIRACGEVSFRTRQMRLPSRAVEKPKKFEQDLLCTPERSGVIDKEDGTGRHVWRYGRMESVKVWKYGR